MTFINTTLRAPQNRSSLLGSLTHMYGIWRQRQNLKSLDDAALLDIGVSRSQADREARRAFWDAPETWRC